MPRVTSSISGDTATGGSYPRLMKGKESGSVYLLTSPKTGTIVHLGANPWRGRKARASGAPSKHAVGYTSSKFDEGNMVPFNGSVTLAIAS